MDRWKKELLDFASHLSFVTMIGGIFIYLIVSIITGGDMKNLLIPTSFSLLICLAAFKFWRFRIREIKEIDKYFLNLDRYHNPSLKKQYRIKKSGIIEVEMLLKTNDICIVETRNLSSEFETLIFFKDSQDFLVVNSRLSWEIRDPLKMILNSGDMSYKKTTEWLTDILGNTLVIN